MASHYADTENPEEMLTFSHSDLLKITCHEYVMAFCIMSIQTEVTQWKDLEVFTHLLVISHLVWKPHLQRIYNLYIYSKVKLQLQRN